jgi:hypothetical protein
MGRPDTARNSNGPGRPEIQTIRAFSGLGRVGPGGPNVHLYVSDSVLARVLSGASVVCFCCLFWTSGEKHFSMVHSGCL